MERVRIGIIGCGGMARHHGRIFTRETPEAEIVALAEPNPKNLAAFIQDVWRGGEPEVQTYTDYREMMRSGGLDGVVIVTPHNQHFTQATEAIDAGCHVLVEKPMVISTADALKLIAHADAHKKVVSVAFPGPFTREFQYIRQAFQNGTFGEVSLVQAVCAQPWIQYQRGAWRADPVQSGGGNMYDSGAHMFNAMLYLTGLPVTEVFAFTNNKGEAVDVIGGVTLRYANGAIGTASVSGDSTFFEQGVYIQGTQGSVKTSIYGGDMEVFVGGRKLKYPVVPETSHPQQNFVDCIRGRAETPSPAVLGLWQARLMDAIYESAATGNVVKVVNES